MQHDTKHRSEDCSASTGWTTEILEFDSRQGQTDFPLLHSTQTCCDVHAASFLTGIGDSFSWGKSARTWK
jgi:hypothetical protein